jgi:hypothetical protein
LVQFQATRAEKEDTRKLLHTINKALDKQALSETQLNSTFDIWWPKLEERLGSIPPFQGSAPPQRPEREILEELLELVRGVARSTTQTEKVTIVTGPGRGFSRSLYRVPDSILDRYDLSSDDEGPIRFLKNNADPEGVEKAVREIIQGTSGPYSSVAATDFPPPPKDPQK